MWGLGSALCKQIFKKKTNCPGTEEQWRKCRHGKEQILHSFLLAKSIVVRHLIHDRSIARQSITSSSINYDPCCITNSIISVADPGGLYRIPDPNFLQPRSRI
jgi:hypothetical protein